MANCINGFKNGIRYIEENNTGALQEDETYPRKRPAKNVLATPC